MSLNYQRRVWNNWFVKCFDDDTVAPTVHERIARLIEEVAELAQSTLYPYGEAVKGFDEVYHRRDHVGEPSQEIGGVYLTLATVCTALNVNGEAQAELELARVQTKIPQIREKSRLRRLAWNKTGEGDETSKLD